jgi:hypothetical protein
MNEVMKSVVKSYVRGVLVAILPLLSINCTDPRAYVAAIAAGVVSPALRALDKKDPAFGMVANAVDVEIEKLVKADKKKK